MKALLALVLLGGTVGAATLAATPERVKAKLAAMFEPALPAGPATLAVTPETLKASLVRARPGDTLALAPGEYGPLTLRARRGLTIRGGSFTAITVLGGDTLAFVDTRVAAEPKVRHSPMVGITDATGVSFTRLKIVATLSADGARKGYGVKVMRSNTIAFTDLYVEGAAKGMVILMARAISVRGAVLERLQSDGIQVGNLDDALFENVRVGELKPMPGDHPDGFQTVKPVSHLTIRRFRFESAGEGDGQGIFISDARPPERHTDIVVEDVVIANRFARCLSIDHADRVRLRDITCRSRPPYIHRPGIFLQEVTGLDAADTSGCVHRREAVSGTDVRRKTVKCS